MFETLCDQKRHSERDQFHESEVLDLIGSSMRAGRGIR
jgi:hypothetical protein